MRRNLALGVVLALAACAGGAGGNADGDDSAVNDETGMQARAEATASGAGATDRAEVILFLGTSLTAGYGVGAEFAYPAVLRAKIDSAGYPFRVVNAGLSGETSAGGLRRLEWSLQEPVSILVVELGANDGLRGLSVEELSRNLETIVRRTRDRYPAAGIVIVGMEAPPNMGAAYTNGFRNVFARLARDFDAALVPFLLDGVAGDPALNQDDRIHPTIEGQRRAAENVWTVLEPLLRERVADQAG